MPSREHISVVISVELYDNRYTYTSAESKYEQIKEAIEKIIENDDGVRIQTSSEEQLRSNRYHAE